MALKKKGIFACVLMALIFGILIYVFVYTRRTAHVQGQIIITFDDAGYSQSVLDHALPIMNQYGFKGIVFLPTKYASLEVCQEFIDDGWEIGSHTHSHPHLNNLSEEQLHHEIEYPKQFYETEFPRVNDGMGVITFAYPFGEGWDNETVDSVVTTTYHYVRPVRDSRWGRTFSTSDDDTSIQKTQDAINYARKEGIWVWLMFHGVSDDPLIEYGIRNPEDTVSIRNFNVSIQLVKNSGLSVVTMKDIFQKRIQDIRASENDLSPHFVESKPIPNRRDNTASNHFKISRAH